MRGSTRLKFTLALALATSLFVLARHRSGRPQKRRRAAEALAFAA